MHNLNNPEFLKICDNILSTTDSGKLKTYAYDLQDYYSDNLPGITYTEREYNPTAKIQRMVCRSLFGIYNTETF